MTDQRTRVVTGKVRLSFPNLFKAEQIMGEGAPKYSTMILIPKSDKATIKALRAAEAQAAKDATNTKFGGTLPDNLGSIIKDGDEDGTAKDYPERKGHLYMSVSSDEKYRPGVIDRNKQEIMDQSEVYSGVNARVSLTAFGYTFGKKKGISFGLNNVQILGGGEPLTGGPKAEDEFDEVEDDDEDLI